MTFEVTSLLGTKKLPSSAMEIKYGVVRGGRYIVELIQKRHVDGEFIFLERYVDGKSNNIRASIEKEGNILTISAPITPDVCIEKVHLLLQDGAATYRIRFTTDTYFLDRLVCVNEREIRRNIRWTGKIADYETLMFSAIQSFGIQRDSRLKLHCLLPVAYQSLEREDASTKATALIMLNEARESFRHELDKESFISYLTACWHHQLDAGQLGPLLNTLSQIREQASDLSIAPLATYNAIRGMLLLGFICQIKSEHEMALAIYRECNALFSLSVSRFAQEALNLYRELRSIYDCAFHAVIGINEITGGKVRGYSLTCDNVIMHASRVNSIDKKRYFSKKLKLIVLENS
ncbi:hypothetical protein sphantq_01987 [Sphingobium sp. AntQ-1]|uniref:hypothetical protein n=1 Tax=Sphingobium sp. AntQ-1 TaxID=2930091 RepID=UPI00234ECFF7|nr:hypothetical protein [Sphingobium sp. AntQ-1]WCP13558.1 hypothetical protein sphantq_01987 [Sphingobium sp. AntQ-1]